MALSVSKRIFHQATIHVKLRRHVTVITRAACVRCACDVDAHLFWSSTPGTSTWPCSHPRLAQLQTTRTYSGDVIETVYKQKTLIVVN